MRKTQAKKLPLAPDAKYNDILVTRFVNNLMWQGKKNTAFGLFTMPWSVFQNNPMRTAMKSGKGRCTMLRLL